MFGKFVVSLDTEVTGSSKCLVVTISPRPILLYGESNESIIFTIEGYAFDINLEIKALRCQIYIK